MKILLTILLLLLTGCSQQVGGGAILPIEKLETAKGEITVNNSDDNTNETFIIKSDSKRYYGSEGNFNMILGITNLRDDEVGTLKLKYSKGERINSVSKYVPVDSTVDVPVFSNVEIKTATSTYMAARQTGTTTKNIVLDTWENINLINKTEKTSILKKETVGTYDDKEVKYLFPKGTTFLKVNISHDANVIDKFYIEIFGDKGGYGMLDPIIDSLVSYWKLDETSGNRADSEGSNTMAPAGTTTYDTGKINNAFSVAGAGNLGIADASQTGLDPAGDFSISLWFNSANTSSNGSLFTKDVSGGRSYFFYVGSDAVLTFWINASDSVVKEDSTISTGNWYHAVVTYDYVGNGTSLMKMYLNGALQTTNGNITNAVGPVTDSETAVQIGAREYTTLRAFFNGLIDEVGFWSKVLTPTEITSLYNSGNGLAYPFSTPSAATASQESDLILYE